MGGAAPLLQEMESAASPGDKPAAALELGWLAELEGKVQQLQSYRDDYLRNSQSAGPIDAVKLQNYRMFLDRLGEALRQQLKLLDAARAEYEKRRALWSEKRIEAESLGRVVDRFRKEERHAADTREQREGDDAALRASVAARVETGNR